MKVSTTSFLLASLYGSAWAAPVNDLTKSLTGALGQSDSIVGRDAPISGELVGSALESETGTGGLSNVAGVNDLTKSLTGALGQSESIVGRDDEQKASAVLPEYKLVATGHMADVDIRADATNFEARNMDAHLESVDNDADTHLHPFIPEESPINVKANVVADAVAKGN
ncbi:hypothetical protein MY10362_008852 [Beauveria mimosiformis]